MKILLKANKKFDFQAVELHDWFRMINENLKVIGDALTKLLIFIIYDNKEESQSIISLDRILWIINKRKGKVR